MESFSGAARALGVSQPTLTRQVHALESDYGFPLLVRTTRWVRLTQEGYKLLALCDPIFDGLENVEDFLKSQNTRTVKINSVLHSKVSDFLVTAYASFPRLRFEVDIMPSTQVISTLLRRECDFGILTLTEPSPEVAYFKLAQGTIIALVAPNHAWRNRRSISIKELEGQRVVLASRSGQSRLLLDKNLARYGVSVTIAQVVDSIEVLWDLVRRGVGIGITGHTGFADRLICHYLTFSEETLAIDLHFACRRERLRTDVFSGIYETVKSQLVDRDE